MATFLFYNLSFCDLSFGISVLGQNFPLHPLIPWWANVPSHHTSHFRIPRVTQHGPYRSGTLLRMQPEIEHVYIYSPLLSITHANRERRLIALLPNGTQSHRTKGKKPSTFPPMVGFSVPLESPLLGSVNESYLVCGIAGGTEGVPKVY